MLTSYHPPEENSYLGRLAAHEQADAENPAGSPNVKECEQGHSYEAG